MKIAIIINPARLPDELKEKLASPKFAETYQINYDIYTPETKDMDNTLQEIKEKSYQAYLIGGGDGTVRQAIQILGNEDKPIGVLPLGTFNLFAKSLDLPNDTEKIFEIIKNNKTKLVDLSTVNDKVIINHFWIGFYFYILKQRKKHRQFLGRSRLLKSIFNTLVFFKYLPIYQLEVQVDGQKATYHTCLVYIGNNEFYTSLFDIGDRKTLSSGLMSITILNVKNRWQLLGCLFDLIFKKVKQSKYLTYFCTNEFSITAKHKSINVVIDGELFTLSSPLKFCNNQKKLKVFIP